MALDMISNISNQSRLPLFAIWNNQESQNLLNWIFDTSLQFKRLCGLSGKSVKLIYLQSLMFCGFVFPFPQSLVQDRSALIARFARTRAALGALSHKQFQISRYAQPFFRSYNGLRVKLISLAWLQQLIFCKKIYLKYLLLVQHTCLFLPTLASRKIIAQKGFAL